MARAMLPKQIDPFQLVDHETTLKGDLSLSEMVRLQEFLYEKSGVATIHLEFGRDKLGFAFIRGIIKTGFKVICQRCNTPMTLDLVIAVEDSPVRSDEEAEQLPKNYDPILLGSGELSLLTMVEEEILLSIPIVPRHPERECPVKTSQLAEWEDEKDDTNPFLTLKKLLRE